MEIFPLPSPTRDPNFITLRTPHAGYASWEEFVGTGRSSLIPWPGMDPLAAPTERLAAQAKAFSRRYKAPEWYAVQCAEILRRREAGEQAMMEAERAAAVEEVKALRRAHADEVIAGRGDWREFLLSDMALVKAAAAARAHLCGCSPAEVAVFVREVEKSHRSERSGEGPSYAGKGHGGDE